MKQPTLVADKKYLKTVGNMRKAESLYVSLDIGIQTAHTKKRMEKLGKRIVNLGAEVRKYKALKGLKNG